MTDPKGPNPTFPFLYVTIHPHFNSLLQLQTFIIELAEAHNKLAGLMIAHMNDHLDPIVVKQPISTILPSNISKPSVPAPQSVGIRSERRINTPGDTITTPEVKRQSDTDKIESIDEYNKRKYDLPPGRRCNRCDQEFKVGEEMVFDGKAWSHFQCPLPPNNSDAIADMVKFIDKSQAVIGETIAGPIDLDKLAGMSYMDKRAFLIQWKFYCKCVAPRPLPNATNSLPFLSCGECNRPIIEEDHDV